MALDMARLGTSMKTEIEAIAGITISSPQELKKFCDAVAKAVVEEIQQNAEVEVETPGADPGVVTLPGTGTVT